MEIVWQNENLKSQYAFLQRAEWSGVRVHRARVMAGRMLEHEAEFHEINISISGNLTTEKNTSTGRRKIFCGTGGGICLTQAGESIGACWENPIDNLGIFLAPDFVAQTAAENHFSAGFEFNDEPHEKDALIQHIGFALLTESQTKTPAGKIYADSLIQTLTLHLLKNYSTARLLPQTTVAGNGGLSGYKLRLVKEFINAHLEDDLTLADIAAVANLSQFHFARSFRRSTGQTPQQYLTERRIERAKELLAQAELPIVEVGLQTGFKNQSHFTTLFRKYTKLTPKLWREIKLA